MYRQTADWVLREFVKYLFRPKGFEVRVAGLCVPVLVALLGGNWLVKATARDEYSFEIGSTNFIPEWIQWPLVALFVTIFVMCFVVGWRRFTRENELRNRKKVIVIEGRGLREDDGSPLAAAVPSDIVGHRIAVSLDLRQRRDGMIVEAAELLPEVDIARRTVQQYAKQNDRQDVTFVYGGLTPVPMTFLTGVAFDDEGSIVVMDWDRTREAWRSLDSRDDGQRFLLEGVEGVGNASEVVLAVSASYQVRSENISTTFDLPVVRLSLPDLNSSHWSQAKQNALAEQLFEAAKLLEAKGVKTIHLLLAAQNSVAFNLGRRYDKRNLPGVVVYQYEANSEKKFPWGVRMPVRGENIPSILRT
ncbi:SAVED domain-containing protein [Rhizobium leguminosarum]|uniref:SAVED domain-containing protein n=1 Tax=Rhizobium leguminosarum TaxID=384 RepID=UPI0010319A93|nr:SAVED domain-containing protein [Rhizobium leguminosarum]TAU83276.1 SAVED domain-containing protein [Rhizobium leguminosarum]